METKWKLLVLLMALFCYQRSYAQMQFFQENLPSNIDPGSLDDLLRQGNLQQPSGASPWVQQVLQITQPAADRLRQVMEQDDPGFLQQYREDVKRLAEEIEASPERANELTMDMENRYRDQFMEKINQASIELPDLRQQIRAIIPTHCVILEFLNIRCDEVPNHVDIPALPNVKFEVLPPSKSTDPPAPPAPGNESKAMPHLPKIQQFVKSGPFSYQDTREFGAGLKFDLNKGAIAIAPRKYGSITLGSIFGIAGVSEAHSKVGSMIKVPAGVERVDVEIKVKYDYGNVHAVAVIGGAWAKAEHEIAVIGPAVRRNKKVVNCQVVAPLIWGASEKVGKSNVSRRLSFKPSSSGGEYLVTYGHLANEGLVLIGGALAFANYSITEMRYTFIRK